MTERREIQIPVWCSALCRNAYNEKCVTECSVKRDCSYFEEKPNLNLSNMPKFPETKGLTREEKFTSVTVYLSKVFDHLQGNEDEHPIRIPAKRHGLQDFRHRSLPENLKAGEVLSGILKTNSSAEIEKKYGNSEVESSEVTSNSDL